MLLSLVSGGRVSSVLVESVGLDLVVGFVICG